MLLVLHQGAIGDYLLTLSVIAAVREHLRETQVVAIASAPSARWSAGRCAVDQHISPESVALHTLFTPEGPPDPSLAKLLQQADCLLNFLTGPIESLHQRLSAATSAHVISVDPRPKPGTLQAGTHITDQWATDIRAQGLPIGPPIAPRIRRQPTLRRSNRIILHPGSGGKRKCWPIENFLSLADGITKHGHTVTWMLGPAECEPGDPRTDALRRRSTRTNEPVILKHDLAAASDQITTSNLYIGNDSGMTHLAAATGTPTIALFVATDPRTWRPLGENVHVVNARTGTGKIEARVVEEFTRLIGDPSGRTVV